MGYAPGVYNLWQIICDTNFRLFRYLYSISEIFCLVCKGTLGSAEKLGWGEVCVSILACVFLKFGNQV